MPWGLKRCVIAMLLVLAAWSSAAPAAATPGGVPVATCVARIAVGDDPARLIRAPARFDCRTPQPQLGPGDYWALSAPLPTDAGRAKAVDVRFASLWQDRVTLYALFADGRIARGSLDAHGTSRALQLGAMVKLRVPDRRVPVTRLLFRVDGARNLRGIVNGVAVATPLENGEANLRMAAFYGAFGGLCVALLVYNLALWGALRHHFQLAYCAMLAALLLYAFSSSGALAWAWPAIDNNDRMRVNYLSLGASAMAALAFAQCFFERRVFAGWLQRAAAGVHAALGGSALAFALFAPHAIKLLDRLYAGSFVLLLALVPPMLLRAWRRRSNYLWLFALAWGLPVAFATLRVASNFNLIGWNLWIDNSTVVTMAAEALLSSLAIAYRMRLLTRERDEAREQEIAARLLADTDPLTGLMNRRAFLHHAIGRPTEQTLVLADIDHFKAVNDTLGHDGGDEVLRLIARALRHEVPADALVARIGGEEFAIVVPAASPFVPARLLERVRGERMPFDLTVTISIGTCTGPLDCESDWKRLYRLADRALFEAKAAGRDRARDAAQLPLAA